MQKLQLFSATEIVMPLIETHELCKTYRLGEIEVPALRNISLRIEPGEFTALWGPSGSGKSTLLNLLGLIDTPSAGNIILNGRDTANMTDAARARLRNEGIGFIFQGFNLIPVLSALENVMLPLSIRGVSRTRAHCEADRRLAEVGLGKYTHHRPDQLSGGQRQRVAIARALVTNPLLIIADEPTANLDAATGLAVIEQMKALNHTLGVTFLFSTHDPRLLGHLQRIVRLSDGEILEDSMDALPNLSTTLPPSPTHTEGAAA
jgi:putative ABC transport system ATP-binding protein